MAERRYATHRLKRVDLFATARAHVGRWVPLGELLALNGLEAKSGSGEDAVRHWDAVQMGSPEEAEAGRAALRAYCMARRAAHGGSSRCAARPRCPPRAAPCAAPAGSWSVASASVALDRALVIECDKQSERLRGIQAVDMRPALHLRLHPLGADTDKAFVAPHGTGRDFRAPKSHLILPQRK